MTPWAKTQWKKFTLSYDTQAAAVQSSPGVIALGAGSVIVCILASGYVPALAAISHFRAPFVPALLATVGAIWSYTAYRHKATGTLGALGMLLDTLLYSAAFSFAAVLTSGPFALGFAIALTLFLVGFPARVYALTLPIALAMCGPPVIVTLLLGREPLVAVVVWAACTVALTTSHRAGQKRSLQAQNEQLRSALGAADRVADQRMEAGLTAALVDIGSFLHELRNVRAAQQANLQFILEEGALQGEPRAALEEALAAQAEENRLVAEAIDRLRRKGTPQDTDFVLHDVLDEFARDHERGFPVRFQVHAPRFLIQGDPEHVKAVLHNLARNAVQAGASRVDVLLNANSDSKSVMLIVQDDGPGFKPDQLATLFRPFAPGGRNEGTGLGLYLTRRYIDLLGGHIDATNRPEGGAAFRVLLPGKLIAEPGAARPQN